MDATGIYDFEESLEMMCSTDGVDWVKDKRKANEFAAFLDAQGIAYRMKEADYELGGYQATFQLIFAPVKPVERHKRKVRASRKLGRPTGDWTMQEIEQRVHDPLVHAVPKSMARLLLDELNGRRAEK